jgi:hypothetical protein
MTVCRQQDDVAPPDVLLRAVAVGPDRQQLRTIRSRHGDADSAGHAPASHAEPRRGNPRRTLPLDFLHSHVRHFKEQAWKFFGRSSSLSAWPPLDRAGGTIMKRRLIML